MEDIITRISGARVAHGNLRHLWRMTDISLTTKGGVYNCTVCPTYIRL